MKQGIHPVYYKDAEIKCACGNIITAGSVNKELKTDICSACHPFYTGKQKLIDSAGRVDKFLAKQKVAEERAEIAKQTLMDKKGGKKSEKFMTMEEIKAIKEKNQPKHEKLDQSVQPVPEEIVPAEQGEMIFEERKPAAAVTETAKSEKKPAVKTPVKTAKAPKVPKAAKAIKTAAKKANAKKAQVKKAAPKKAPVKKSAVPKAKKPTAKAKKPAKKASK